MTSRVPSQGLLGKFDPTIAVFEGGFFFLMKKLGQCPFSVVAAVLVPLR